MKRFQIAASTGVLALLAVGAAGILAGSWAARSGKTIPIMMASRVSASPSGVSFEEGFAPVVRQAVPAVVNVSSSRIVKTPGSSMESPFFSDPFFRQFFGNQVPRQFQNPPSSQREHGLGSGVIVNASGYILTNNHVVEGAKDVKVLLSDNRQFDAKVVGTDAKTDIAILKVNATKLPVLTFGDSSKMQAGNFVLAIGNPFGLNQTVTLGIVSATGRGGLGIEDYEDFIQTDAAINPGNSGGALINEQGDLIGINTAILTGGGGGNQGVGFAIPINMARNVMNQILKNGKVTRGWLGVSIQPVTQDIANAFHMSGNYGALVADVTKDSPAAKSGLETGDVILDVNGKRIEDSRALQLMVGTMSPGDTVNLTVFRNGGTRSISVKLGEMPANVSQSTSAGGSPETTLRGISVEPLTSDIASELKLPANTRGVVVSNVDSSSTAADAGLQQGDVIQEVNHQPITTVDGFNRAMRSAGNQPVVLLINRNGTTTFVVVQSQ